MDPRGTTGIGAAVVEGADALADAQAIASPPYDVQGLVVLTDGNENVDPKITAVAASINAHTFAIGFGTPANVSAAALSSLANATGGYLLVTGALNQDQTFRLSKYFLQVLAGLTNAQIVVDPVGDLVLGPTHRVPFTVTEADYAVDVILLSPMPRLIEFALETPDGTIIDPSLSGVEPTISFVSGPRVSYYRMGLPALQSKPGSAHAGEWRAILRLGSRNVSRAQECVARATGRVGQTWIAAVLGHRSRAVDTGARRGTDPAQRGAGGSDRNRRQVDGVRRAGRARSGLGGDRGSQGRTIDGDTDPDRQRRFQRRVQRRT